MRLAIAVLTSSCLTACAAEPDSSDDGCEDHEAQLAAFSTVPPPVATLGSFQLVLLDVGQGDAAVVIAPGGCAALLDGGPTGAGDAVIKPALASLGVTSLEFAVASHLHADHLGGIDEVDAGAGAVPIPTIYDRGGTYSSATFDQYNAHFGNRRQKAIAGQSWSLCGEVTFDVVAADANGTSTTNENARSVVVRVRHGAFEALVGGDLTGASPNIETSIAPAVGEVEVYKVHHHGSSTSSNATFLGTVLPTVALIPVGADNTYGHPTPEALSRLDAVGAEVWMTEDPGANRALGHIQVITDGGSSYQVVQGSSSRTYAMKGAPPGDTTPPSVPTGVTATAASSTRIDVSWSASTDDVGVASYTVRRGGATLATSTATSYADASVSPGQTYSYTITASDAAGNTSAASAPATATTPGGTCTVAITQLQYSDGNDQLSIRATSSQQPSAVLSATADGAPLGTMSFLASKGYYELKVKRSASPACVGVTASCGGSATRCF